MYIVFELHPSLLSFSSDPTEMKYILLYWLPIPRTLFQVPFVRLLLFSFSFFFRIFFQFIASQSSFGGRMLVNFACEDYTYIPKVETYSVIPTDYH